MTDFGTTAQTTSADLQNAASDILPFASAVYSNTGAPAGWMRLGVPSLGIETGYYGAAFRNPLRNFADLVSWSNATITLFVSAMLFASNVMAAGNAKQKVELPCGQYKVSLTCGRDQTPKSEDSRECNHNTLIFHSPTGVNTVIKDPPLTKKFHDDKRPVMLDDTTPMSLQCVRTLTGKEYVMVEYGRSLGGGFTNEYFYDWFETNGVRLTSISVRLKKNFKSPITSMDDKHSSKTVALEGEKK